MAAEADDRDVLRCSICQEISTNPVIIPCGHSFCKDCITGLWDQDVCRCPQCEQTFSNKPLIDWQHVKELSEKLMKMRPKADEDDEDAEEHEVSCDSCTSRRTKAVQSCLTCVSSFCRNHLEKHNELHGWNKHLLTKATDLQSKTCSLHGKLMDVFCRTDQKCVCVLCAIHNHKHHDTVSASEERADRQRKLKETCEKYLQSMQDREKDLNDLAQAEQSITHSAETAAAESERIFSDMVNAVQNTSIRVKELIAERQRAELSRIEGLKEKVQQKMYATRVNKYALEELLTIEDHIHFLQKYPESTSEEFEDLSNISENPKAFFCNVELLLSKMQVCLMDVTKKTEIKIKSGKVVPPKADTPVAVAAALAKKDGQWDCAYSERSEGTSIQSVSCQKSNPNIKSISSSPVSFGSSANQPALTGVKGPLNSGLNQSTDNASSVIFGGLSTRSTGVFTFGSSS